MSEKIYTSHITIITIRYSTNVWILPVVESQVTPKSFPHHVVCLSTNTNLQP